MRSGFAARMIQPALESFEQNLVDQRGLARAGHAGDTREDTEREFDIHAFEIVFGGRFHFNALSQAVAASLNRQLYAPSAAEVIAGQRLFTADDVAEFALCDLSLTPPLGQPPMKSYLQFNDGWPANSWEITENSNGYQVQYIRLLAMFAS